MMLPRKEGRVYLVGAGPGDPGLLTLRAKDCIERADVVVYDHLANRAFLDYANKQAEILYAGKKGGSHAMSQQEINRLICQKAAMGLTVVRLKGGDPFLFGRGGEEAQELVRAGIHFEVVPGVTSAVAVPAYAGIPLTHRDYASTVAFITGHEDPLKEQSSIDWGKLSSGAGTLVFLMGIGNLTKISRELIRNGRSPDTPAAVIMQGTVPGQKTVTGRLGDIGEIAERAGMKPPGIIVVGDVVGLRDELNWFEKKVLFGKRIVVTRARDQASDLLKRLTELGAECIEFPTIEVIPPESYDPMDRAIQSIENYDWLLFTSVNGVKYFFQRLEELGNDIRCLRDIKVGAIGPKTAGAIRAKGIRPDLMPAEYRAESVAEAFKKEVSGNVKILLPRAAGAREVLPEELSSMGCYVEVVEAYRTVRPDTGKEEILSMLKKGNIHMVTFTSSSTVTNFMEIFGEGGDRIKKWMEKISVACIGPVTAHTAEEKGLKVDITPREYTIEALTDAIVGFFT
jgi:uroporphyrinogen III methyltransferase/synthase